MLYVLPCVEIETNKGLEVIAAPKHLDPMMWAVVEGEEGEDEFEVVEFFGSEDEAQEALEELQEELGE